MNDSTRILMPRSLTAENGAKGALSGEFKEVIENPYHCRCGEGPDECEACFITEDNDISETISVVVSWTTIKEIYAAAVKLFENAEENVATKVNCDV